MRLTRLLTKKIDSWTPNQRPASLWQDPIFGYFETHGKMEFKPGEEYDLTDEQKKGVMERYIRKEKLKREFKLLQYNPQRFKYIQGVIMDPAMFRWYATEMSHMERFRVTPRTVFVLIGSIVFVVYVYTCFLTKPRLTFEDRCYKGEILWWDRQSRWGTESGVGWAQP